MNMYQSNTYMEDFSWLHFYHEPRKKQKGLDQQSYIPISVAYLTYPSSRQEHKQRHDYSIFYYYYSQLGFTLCKAEQPLQGMELQENEERKNEADIGKLFRKSSKKKVSIKSRLIEVIQTIGQRKTLTPGSKFQILAV